MKTKYKEITFYIYDGMNSIERNIKRFIDIFLSLIALILFSPLFIICFFAVKYSDGGDAIFKQERIC